MPYNKHQMLNLDWFWKGLLTVLTISFLVVKKIKSLLRTILALIYQRQKRARLFRNIIISQDQVLARLRMLPRFPQEIIICLSPEEDPSRGKALVQSIRHWSTLLQIPSTKLYTLKQLEAQPKQQSRMGLAEDCNQQTLQQFYTKFIKQVNRGEYKPYRSCCPLILCFNSIPYLCGLPFRDLKNGEIIFCGRDEFSVIDYQGCLKRYSKIQQRHGR